MVHTARASASLLQSVGADGSLAAWQRAASVRFPPGRLGDVVSRTSAPELPPFPDTD